MHVELLFWAGCPSHEKALRELGGHWAPYRSVAAWYLWRVANEPKPKP